MLARGDGERCDGDGDRHSVHGCSRGGTRHSSGGEGRRRSWASSTRGVLCEGGGGQWSTSLWQGDDLTCPLCPCCGSPLYWSSITGDDGGKGGAACGWEDGSASVLWVLVWRSGHVHVVRQHWGLLTSSGVSDDKTFVSLNTWDLA